MRSPLGSFRLRNTMNGLIWILREEDGELRRHSVLGLHPDEMGLLQLIEKPVEPLRAPFHFTSIPRIVEDLLGPRESTARTLTDPEHREQGVEESAASVDNGPS